MDNKLALGLRDRLIRQFQRLRLEFLLRKDNELNQIDDMPRFDFVRRVKLGIRN